MDGVCLYTYHGSKGLEWDTVILISLDDDPLNTNKLQSRYFYGVQAFHNVRPRCSTERVVVPALDSMYKQTINCRINTI